MFIHKNRLNGKTGIQRVMMFLDCGAQYMIILLLVFIVQFSVSSACLAITKEQQVTSAGAPLAKSNAELLSSPGRFFISSKDVS